MSPSSDIHLSIFYPSMNLGTKWHKAVEEFTLCGLLLSTKTGKQLCDFPWFINTLISKKYEKLCKNFAVVISNDSIKGGWLNLTGIYLPTGLKAYIGNFFLGLLMICKGTRLYSIKLEWVGKYRLRQSLSESITALSDKKKVIMIWTLRILVCWAFGIF